MPTAAQSMVVGDIEVGHRFGLMESYASRQAPPSVVDVPFRESHAEAHDGSAAYLRAQTLWVEYDTTVYDA